MHDILQQLTGFLRGMWHRRWIGLAVAWLAAVIGIVVVYRIPEKFEASARVYVDTESLLRPLLAGLAVQPNLDQQVSLISRTLISRPNVDKLIRMADMDFGTRSNPEREELIDAIIRTIRLEGNAQTNLYIISYRDSSPVQARKVVQSLLTIFVESSLGDKRQDTQTAVKFLDDQIKNYERNLEASENRLKEFKLKYMGVTGNSQGQDYFGRVAKVASDIELAKLELQSAEQARDAYRKQIAGEEPIFLPEATEGAVAQEGGNTEVDARINALKRDLDSLLRKYTDQHPDVMATQRLIQQLEEQR
jgi:polysaccharide chain length determinant protein (PEP-CTERM system associated)